MAAAWGIEKHTAVASQRKNESMNTNEGVHVDVNPNETTVDMTVTYGIGSLTIQLSVKQASGMAFALNNCADTVRKAIAKAEDEDFANEEEMLTEAGEWLYQTALHEGCENTQELADATQALVEDVFTDAEKHGRKLKLEDVQQEAYEEWNATHRGEDFMATQR
jgi:hypothetical protein